MKKTLTNAIFAVCALAASQIFVTSCGGDSSANVSDSEMDRIEQAINENATQKQHNSQHIDSLALMADDLTPSEAAQVLATYMQIVNDAKADNNRTLRLETMRKFVDVYDIVMSVNGSEMRPMFERLAKRVPEFNIIATASDYRGELNDIADGSADDGASVEEQRPDTSATKIDTLSTSAATSAPVLE